MSIERASISQDYVFVSYLEDVKGRLRAYSFKDGKWNYKPVRFPDNGSLRVTSSSPSSHRVLVNYESFIQPDSLYLLDDRKLHPRKIRDLPTRFNAKGLKVEQKIAVSKDGTKVPYFLIAKKKIKPTGTNPHYFMVTGVLKSP